MRRAAAALATVVVLAALVGAGCAKNAYLAPERYDRGLVVCLSGAGGGLAGECGRIQGGLAAGGVDRAIEIFDWSGGTVLDDQTAVIQNRLKGAELARHLEEYMMAYPGRPVHLVGISAGTGVAVWALEDLAGPFQVEGAILLASSLEAQYDLSPALSRVKDHIYTFNSLADGVLGLGVPLSGTVDQEGAVAGGFIGFRPPAGAGDGQEALYRDKLIQHMWWPGEAVFGNLGDHLGTTNPLFVQARLAPIIKGQAAAAPAAPAVATAKAPAKAPAKPADNRDRAAGPARERCGRTDGRQACPEQGRRGRAGAVRRLERGRRRRPPAGPGRGFGQTDGRRRRRR